MTILKILSFQLLLNNLRFSFFVYTVIKWALNTSLTFFYISNFLRTTLCLVKKWMIFLFFPTMTMRTRSHLITSLIILSNKSTWLPVSTCLIAIILKYIRFSSKILIIMSIHTLRFIMLIIKWTPFSLEVKHVEISISIHVVD